MWQCRAVLQKVKLNRLQPKAKVMVMGEFWAAMTEGDGNYNLHRFLEAEGAECIPTTHFEPFDVEYLGSGTSTHQKRTTPCRRWEKSRLWQCQKPDLLIRTAKVAVKTHFSLYAKAIGLHDYQVPNMEKMATLAEQYYTLDCSGGEGHLEVAHLIESVKHKLSHLVISSQTFWMYAFISSLRW